MVGSRVEAGRAGRLDLFCVDDFRYAYGGASRLALGFDVDGVAFYTEEPHMNQITLQIVAHVSSSPV
jgi:hypothetical protein